MFYKSVLRYHLQVDVRVRYSFLCVVLALNFVLGFSQIILVNFRDNMDKVLKRVTHKKQSSSSGSTKSKDYNNVPSSSINKRYSVDDNFYTYVNRGELYQNCNGNNYYTISNRGDFKRTMHRSRSAKQENGERQIAREDVTFRKFLRVFNSGENGRAAKDWLATSANNMMDFAPKILTKRFCGKKGDNELYRSNSFKFERFERTDSDTLTTSKKSPVSRQVNRKFYFTSDENQVHAVMLSD